jgi:hypothetical protein
MYPMANHDFIDTGLRIIKHCNMYSEEYKNWIRCKNKVPPIVKIIKSFKEYWVKAIALLTQRPVLAAKHG